MINSNIKMLRGIILPPKDRKTTDTDKRDPIEFDLIILIIDCQPRGLAFSISTETKNYASNIEILLRSTELSRG